MIWTEPKTNWNGKSGEYFNVFPDYQRIRSNILYLQEYAERINIKIDLIPMVDATEDLLDPLVSFFNNVVYNVDRIREKVGTPRNYGIMRTYVELGNGWDYRDLNIIEKNIDVLKQEIDSVYLAKEQLPFIQMGMDYEI